MLRVRMLGSFTVELNGAPVDPPESRRAWALLGWLALHPGNHPRGGLAARFWPDTPDASARASLRSALWSLRRALGADGGRHLAATRDRVGLDPARLWTDTAEFDRLVAAGDLAEAVALCRGQLLPGVDDDWVFEARDAHRDRLATALGKLAEKAEESHDLDTAVRITRRQLELVPLSEEVHRRLIRRLAAAGDRAGAMVAYGRLRERFRQELGIAPSPATRRLAESLREARPPPSPPRASGGTASDGSASDRMLPLIGRAEPLARLLASWRIAQLRGGGVVHVSGEAGIGKTRLTIELAARARAAEACVATCAALDLSGATPFGLWAELLRDIYRELEPPPVPAPWVSLLTRLVPDLGSRFGRTPTDALPPELERTRLFEAAVALVEWAARQRPLLIVMDDVHLADSASLALVGYVGRRVTALPVLIVLTRRELPRRAEVDALTHALRSRGALTDEITLYPLPAPALADLVRSVAALPDEQVARVVAAAEGNPLLAAESARALASGMADLPASLGGTVRAALRSLDPDARLLTEFAAVAGRHLEREETDALPLDRPPDAATAAVDSGLLVADGTRIGYRHALLRDAAYEDLPGPRRAWLHETFAAALQSCEARQARRRAAEVARHLRLAGRDELAVGHLARAAADARAVGALTEAAGFLTEAVTLARDDARLLLELAEMEAWNGRREDADRAFDRALELIPPTDLAERARAWLTRGRWLRGALCFPRAAQDAYRSALDLLDAAALPAPGDRAEALAGYAWAEAVAGDAEAVETLLDRLAGLVVPHTDLRTHDVNAARAFSLIRRGRFEESYQPAMLAAEAAVRAGRPDMAYGCWGNAASAAACAGDFVRSLEFAERGQAVVHPVLPTCEVHLLATRAHILARMGRTAEARSVAEAELALAERLDRPELRATALHDCGMVAFAAGDPERAERLLADALAAGAPVSRPRARLARSEALVTLGRLDDAEQEIRATTLEPMTPSDFPHTLVPRLTRIQGLIAAARGDRALAERRLREAADRWRHYTQQGPAGDDYVANLADLGRPPVEGLIEPARELETVLAELESVRTN